MRGYYRGFGERTIEEMSSSVSSDDADVTFCGGSVPQSGSGDSTGKARSPMVEILSASAC